MQGRGFHIRTTTINDWEQIRELRLEMLRETPIAFSETYETAVRHEPSEWMMRGDRGSAENSIALAAIADTGRWIGTMGAFIPPGEQPPLLVGVYVTPSARGQNRGVAHALLSGIEDWAKGWGSELMLHVHQDNTHAIGFYERAGFAFTGRSTAYNLDPSKDELEMLKTL